MSSQEKIRATLTSRHYPGDPAQAPDRLYVIRPRHLLSGHRRQWVIADLYGEQHQRLLVHQVEGYRVRTNALGGDIDLLIDRAFFTVCDMNQQRAYELLWTALIEAHDGLNQAP